MPRIRWSLVHLAAVLVLATTAIDVESAEAAAPAFRGVQLHALWGSTSNAEMDRELDLSRDAGSTTVRVDVGWSSLETGGKGKYSQWYVDKLDRFMNGAHARGMKVIATLWSTPCWASTAPATKKLGCEGAWWERGVTMYPPADNEDFADISAWITARYGAKMAALEVWNEPNLPDDRFWIAPNEPAAYAALVKAAYPAVKAVNPDVKVLAGSLAAADRPFLEALYANGMKGSYDAISIHPYNEWRAPADRWQPQWKQYTFLPGIEWIHEAQQAAGDNTPLWLTEFGWTSCSGGGWCVSEQKQADYTRRALDIVKTKDYIEAAIVYNLRSKGTDAASFEDNFGLVRQDFTPKPAYAALREGLSGTEAAPIPGSDQLPAPSPSPVTGLPAAPEVPAAQPTAPIGPSPEVSSPPSQPRVGQATGRRPSAVSPSRGNKVLVRVRRVGSSVVATGRAPRASQVLLRLTGCRRAEVARPRRVKVSGSGRFTQRLGTAARLAGCRVTGEAPMPA